MVDLYNRNFNKWNLVDGNFKQESKKCPRCNNEVQYLLHWDNDSSVGISIFEIIKFHRYYAFKCPICPNFEAVEKEVAKAIIKGEKNA